MPNAPLVGAFFSAPLIDFPGLLTTCIPGACNVGASSYNRSMSDGQSKSLFAGIGILATAVFLLWLAADSGLPDGLGFITASMIAFGFVLYLKKHPL